VEETPPIRGISGGSSEAITDKIRFGCQEEVTMIWRCLCTLRFVQTEGITIEEEVKGEKEADEREEERFSSSSIDMCLEMTAILILLHLR